MNENMNDSQIKVTAAMVAKARNEAYYFKNLGNAISFANRCRKAHMVLLGEYDRYMVVNLRNAEILMAVGFEQA